MNENVNDTTKVLPLQINYIPEFISKMAEEEFNDSPENRRKGLEELKELLNEDKMTKGIEFEDDFLLVYLLHNKFNADGALAGIRHLLNLRINHSYLFRSIPFDFTTIPAAQFITVLPYRRSDGSVTVLLEFGKIYLDDISFETFKQLAFIVYQQLLRDPVTQVAGFNAIQDYSNTGIRHIRYCTLQNLFLLHHVALDCLPARYLEVHCINGNFLLSTMFTLFKPFMSEKIRKMFHFHSSPDELLNYFPAEVLPVQYGGTLSDYYMADWLKKANKQHEDLTVKGQKNIFP
ncbi:CRAL-TRIO domain-containing protein [Trichonephila inaurata madagascariensis]|uniref:CRAL-TRIO domain-containing protein n=1 Tax=Trichonephila inaurata madagascariensis TaxID=2747483 RepID=A0A8X6X2E8_9ARAC|nr:CRAL-TRIO domain-containing protein [Trichonephila inaurata madagascariensis]